MEFSELIKARKSIRGYQQKPVPREVIEEILEVAKWSPSSMNTQPWHVHVLTGNAKRRLTDAILAAYSGEQAARSYTRLYYMEQIREPYLSRRRKVGWDLYGLLGIAKGDQEGMRRFHARNYDFFGAPVGLILTVEADLGWCSWLDFGMFIQNVMLAARGRGLHTCPQAAFNPYGDVVRQSLGLAAGREIVCGMALGYEDTDAPENRLRTVREPVSGFATFLDE